MQGTSTVLILHLSIVGFAAQGFSMMDDRTATKLPMPEGKASGDSDCVKVE